MRALAICDVPVCSLCVFVGPTPPAWIPHCLEYTHTPDIIGIDPYFPAAMRQLRRDPVPRHYFSFLARDLGCPNSPSVSSRASTIPFPSPACPWRGLAWRRASRPWKFLQEPRTKGTNRRCSNDKQSHDAPSRNRHWRASSSFPTEIWKGFVAKLKFKRRGRKGIYGLIVTRI